jgi:hypothetical protein
MKQHPRVIRRVHPRRAPAAPVLHADGNVASSGVGWAGGPPVTTDCEDGEGHEHGNGEEARVLPLPVCPPAVRPASAPSRRCRRWDAESPGLRLTAARVLPPPLVPTPAPCPLPQPCFVHLCASARAYSAPPRRCCTAARILSSRRPVEKQTRSSSRTFCARPPSNLSARN